MDNRVEDTSADNRMAGTLTAVGILTAAGTLMAAGNKQKDISADNTTTEDNRLNWSHGMTGVASTDRRHQRWT